MAVPIRLAGIGDAAVAAGLLHGFNTEFSAPTPGAEACGGRTRIPLAGGGPYVVPAHRNRGDT